eukprot:XP_003967898.1 PREDICTED: gap junction delta-4 protein [Takifugu rubripes]
MEGSNACEVIFISVNHSITLMGKVWLIVMIFLRVLTLLFAGYPLYQDEQERFVCNTIQPGCANVCYDLYSPISLFRFWLVQLLTLCLPYIIFVVYIIHEVSNDLCVHPNPPGHVKTSQLFQIQQDSFRKAPGSKMATARRSDRCFSGAYVLHLMFRTLLEGGFGAAHYYLFGFYIPRRFLCQHPPCTTQVDCYISRPTEKTVMLNFMLGMAILSLFLNVLDFISSIKRSVTKKGRKKMAVEKNYEEEQCSSSTGVAFRSTDPNAPLTQDLDVEVPQAGSFRKRRNSKGSCGGPDPSSLDRSSSFPRSLGPQGCNTNGNNGYSVPQEDVLENNGSDVALCPPDSMGTPRSIRVSKRGRLKPPPPPRRDLGSCPRGPAGSTGDISAICTKKVGQFTMLEQLQTNDDGQDKRSEWV